MNIFLDLEDTLIENWFEQVFIDNKITFIKNQISNLRTYFNEPDIKLILFSFAVTNDHTQNIFKLRLQKQIEDIFQAKFIKIYQFNKKFVFNLLRKNWNIHISDNEIISDILLGNQKEILFEIISLSDFKNEICVLFDDTVNTFKKDIFDKDLFSRKKTSLVSIRV
jgi:hypothetical protein